MVSIRRTAHGSLLMLKMRSAAFSTDLQVRDDPREHGAGADDDHHLGRAVGGTEEGLPDILERQLPEDQPPDDQRVKAGHCPGLGRGEDASQDAADDDDRGEKREAMPARRCGRPGRGWVCLRTGIPASR